MARTRPSRGAPTNSRCACKRGRRDVARSTVAATSLQTQRALSRPRVLLLIPPTDARRRVTARAYTDARQHSLFVTPGPGPPNSVLGVCRNFQAFRLMSLTRTASILHTRAARPSGADGDERHVLLPPWLVRHDDADWRLHEHTSSRSPRRVHGSGGSAASAFAMGVARLGMTHWNVGVAS